MLHDILVDLLPKVDLRVRRQLSEQLGAMEKPPPELMSLLVHDVIEVSGPLLEHADVSDEDLIDVVKVGSDEHREKIARRPHLAPQIKEALDEIARKKRFLAKARGDYPHDQLQEEEDGYGAAAVETASLQTPLSASDEILPRKASERTATDVAISETRVFEDIIRASVDWTFEIGRDFEITYLSESATRAFGRPARSLTGQLLTEICTLADPRKAATSLHAILDRRRPLRNLIVETHDSIEREKLWWLSAVPNFDLYTGRFTGFRGTAREVLDADLESIENITAKTADQQAPAAPPPPTDQPQPTPDAGTHEVIISPVARNIDKNAAELIQTLSHELRTPLNAILGFSEMIDHETWGPVSAQYHDKTKVILRSAQNLKSAITDVLDVAKIRAGRQHVIPKFFSLAAVIKASIEAVRAEATMLRVKLLPPQSERDVPLLNDPEYLGRCVIKILTYAIGSSRPGASIQIITERTADHRVNIDIPLHGAAHATSKKKSLSDLAPEDGESGSSVAFSLSVAADLAQAIGGEIRLISRKDEVTTLRLTIGDYPIAPDTAA